MDFSRCPLLYRTGRSIGHRQAGYRFRSITGPASGSEVVRDVIRIKMRDVNGGDDIEARRRGTLERYWAARWIACSSGARRCWIRRTQARRGACYSRPRRSRSVQRSIADRCQRTVRKSASDDFGQNLNSGHLFRTKSPISCRGRRSTWFVQRRRRHRRASSTPGCVQGGMLRPEPVPANAWVGVPGRLPPGSLDVGARKP